MENKKEILEEVLVKFLNNLSNNQIDIDPDIVKMVNDNFWDLS